MVVAMWTLIFLSLLLSCQEQKPLGKMVQIADREEEGIRPLRYRLRLFPGWEAHETEQTEDTTKPIGRFTKNAVTVVIHTFHTPIPPESQLARWVKTIDSETVKITPIARGGFFGLMLEGEGEEGALLAVSMQLDQDYPLPWHYTIKAVGPIEAMDALRHELLAMMESFELIRELPERRY